MGKFFIGLMAVIVVPLLLALGIWFGGPKLLQHFADSENARKVVAVQEIALKSDQADVNSSQASCASEIKASMVAAAAIAKAAQIQPVKVGQPQPLITADQIQDIMK